MRTVTIDPSKDRGGEPEARAEAAELHDIQKNSQCVFSNDNYWSNEISISDNISRSGVRSISKTLKQLE